MLILLSTLQDAGQGNSEVKFQNWPQTLILQLIPKDLAQTIGSHFFKNSKSVLFHPEPSESLDALTKTLSSGYAGCVHFTGMFPFWSTEQLSGNVQTPNASNSVLYRCWSSSV